jgi:hypothetical protein
MFEGVTTGAATGAGFVLCSSESRRSSNEVVMTTSSVVIEEEGEADSRRGTENSYGAFPSDGESIG